ncbi:hemerythrin domain-containing protein [Comamonas terrigena]|uniref:hemerythrin domain-containing protein n=1 Tax=Comamonas terrigena TaxID=32013 RepID=UPI002357FD49|nr:hemerythrin domain-containing protein [Comamonas terrigena]
MQIDKFKHQHGDIKRRIAELRDLARAGADTHAEAIAQGIVAMSALIKLHLAVEDQVLHPALQADRQSDLARLARHYQSDMVPIAAAYDAFARRWNTSQRVREDAQGFRDDANLVLRKLHERMLREDREFYPQIEPQELAGAH